MNKKMVSQGPCVVDSVSFDGWADLKMGREMMEKLWNIIGPTIDRNRDLPNWELFVLCYIQGLENGSKSIV